LGSLTAPFVGRCVDSVCVPVVLKCSDSACRIFYFLMIFLETMRAFFMGSFALFGVGTLVPFALEGFDSGIVKSIR
jgi:hypothetical protein